MNPLPRDGAIGWADFSWGIASGCRTGCGYCYARVIANRFKPKGTVLWSSQEAGNGKCYTAGKGDVFPYGFAPTFYPHRLDEPLKVKKPSMIFVCSMGELFGPWVPLDWVKAIYDVMTACVDHTFIVLTKWPGGIRDKLHGFEPDKRWPLFNSRESYPNIWHLTSVEDQATWDKRVPEILKLREHGWPVLGVSVEPMLGPIEPHRIEELDWVIVGGQSPASARQPEHEWVMPIIEQCGVEGIPLFLKNNLKPTINGSLIQQWPKGAPE